jgi:hypothetical protein
LRFDFFLREGVPDREEVGVLALTVARVPPPSAVPRRGALVGALVDADVPRSREMSGINSEVWTATLVEHRDASIAGVIHL